MTLHGHTAKTRALGLLEPGASFLQNGAEWLSTRFCFIIFDCYFCFRRVFFFLLLCAGAHSWSVLYQVCVVGLALLWTRRRCVSGGRSSVGSGTPLPGVDAALGLRRRCGAGLVDVHRKLLRHAGPTHRSVLVCVWVWASILPGELISAIIPQTCIFHNFPISPHSLHKLETQGAMTPSHFSQVEPTCSFC